MDVVLTVWVLVLVAAMAAAVVTAYLLPPEDF